MPPRRQPPPPQTESKAGLVIALVFFVLTTLIAGTLAYLFYGDMTTAKAAAVAEGKKTDDFKKDLAIARMGQTLAYVYVGIANDKERADFANYKQLQQTEYNRELGRLNDEFSKVNKDLAWNAATDAPIKTIVAMLDQYKTDAKNAEDKAKAAEANTATSLIKVASTEDTSDAVGKAASANQKKALDGENKAKADKSKEYLEALELIKKLQNEMAESKKASEDTNVQLAKEVNQLKKTIEEKNILIAKVQGQLDLKRDDVFATDKPKGKVRSVDNRAGIVYVDIGSADFATPQLTFSVLPPNAVGKGVGKRERKASVEIVKILGEHLSQCRIVDATNALQDPILEGDLLFNPAWDPTNREHVALAGFVDLNGDGSDDTAELVRRLTKIGVVVDAYLDMRELVVRGTGLNPNTHYLVLGEIPQADAAQGQGTSEREKKKGEIRERIQKMKEQAKDAGVQIIKMRDFLKQVGFPLPKANASQPDFVPAGTAKTGLGGGDADKPKADKKKDDAKKDEEEKK